MTTILSRHFNSLAAILALGQNLREWTHDYQRRRAFARLAGLDDRMLDDIGLKRTDVEWGLKLPLRDNASILVHHRARQRRRRERNLILKAG